jgi:RNA polymerase sigma factor (sigma-70 family)
VTFDEFLNSQYELINQVIAFTARRHRFNASDAEEFGSLVRLKLVENDYAILRKFEKRSSLRTYLTVVIKRLCLDFRTAQWGKWRPSAEATRQGPVAVLLERLTSRDGYSFSEACELVRTKHDVDLSDSELERLWTLLPKRMPRRQVDERELTNVAADGLDAESAAMQEEDRQEASRFWQTLDRLMDALPAQDRLILKLQFEDGLTVAQISRALKLDQAQLYRRLNGRANGLLATLRRQLEAEGFTADAIQRYLQGKSDDEPPKDDEEAQN